jgi:hypothetical protein
MKQRNILLCLYNYFYDFNARFVILDSLIFFLRHSSLKFLDFKCRNLIVEHIIGWKSYLQREEIELVYLFKLAYSFVLAGKYIE